jgi:signal transduction histidine kinase
VGSWGGYHLTAVTGRTYTFFGALVLALLAFGGLADHALVEQQRAAEAGAHAEVGARADQAAQSVRATLAQLEQDLLGQEPWPGVAVSRRVDPALMTAPRPSTPGFLQRSEAELEALLFSTALSGSGLPEALVAAVALGRPEARSRVAERLLSGFLPVDPDELPYLAHALGVEDDARVQSLRSRLHRAPPAASLPAIPGFRRALTARESVEGWARDDVGVSRYEAPVELLLERAGVADHASVGEDAAVAGEVINVPDVDGLSLSVDPRVPGRLRLWSLRALLWAAVLASVVGLAGLLRGLQREARALEREKAFLTGVTHELRTPLAAIRLFGERLAHGRGDAKEYGSMVAQESERLESLVERVLALPHADETLSFSRLDPTELVRSAVSLATGRAERRRMTLTTDVPALAEVRWNGEAVRQALLNLLDNAIQHGREGGQVEVRAVDRDGFIELSVSDDGPGIGRRDRKRIFGRFERGATASSGTGLGLYLVERVARAHGGRVDLVTEEGQGSTFTLVLPPEPPETGLSSNDPEEPV